MRFYTYCSYRGSYNGYQYAFLGDGKEKEEWRESCLAGEIKNEPLPEEFPEVKRIMEKESGWKLILKTYKKGALLLVSKLEEAPSQEETNNNLKEKEFFYINLAFFGKITELQKIAAFYVGKFIDSKDKDCLNQVIECVKPSDSRERYLLNTAKFKSLVSSMIKSVEGKNREKAVRRYSSHKHLKKNSDKGRRDRKKEIRNLMNDVLLQYKNFSEEYILIVTNGGSSLKREKVNIMFDMDYIR